MSDKIASTASNMSPRSFSAAVGNATKAAMKGTTPGAASSRGASSAGNGVPSLPQSSYWKKKHPLTSEKALEAGHPVSESQEDLDKHIAENLDKTASLRALLAVKDRRLDQYANKHK